MDENKKEEIRKEAKKILDKFAKSLDKVKVSSEKISEKVGGFREEEKTGGEKSDSDFRKRMFKNASSKNDDCIIAEKKSW